MAEFTALPAVLAVEFKSYILFDVGWFEDEEEEDADAEMSYILSALVLLEGVEEFISYSFIEFGVVAVEEISL